MSLLNLSQMVRLYEVYPTGAPLVGGKLYTAQPGTVAGPTQSFPKATYTDATGSVANTNPVVMDGSGKADVWLSGDYSVALYDINGILIESSPDVTGSGLANGIDQISFYDATLATVNVSIPSANGAGANPVLIIKTDTSANLVTITPTTGTILGQVSYSLYTQNESVRLVPYVSANDWKKG
jgi:hypothetical protein